MTEKGLRKLFSGLCAITLCLTGTAGIPSVYGGDTLLYEEERGDGWYLLSPEEESEKELLILEDIGISVEPGNYKAISRDSIM